MEWLKEQEWFQNRKKLILIIAVLVIFLAGSAVAVAWIVTPGIDPQVANIHEKMQQMRKDGKDMTPEQRKKFFEQMREDMESLSDSQKEQLRELRRAEWKKHMEKEKKQLTKFFQLPKKEQNAQLDKDIREFEARRKEWESRRAQFSSKGKGGGKKGGGKKDGSRSSWRERWKNMTDEEKDKKRRQFVDRFLHDPQYAAQKMEYRNMLNDRRKELGLPEIKGFGRRGPRGGR